MRAKVAQSIQRGIDPLRASAAMLGLHARRIVVAADGDAENARLPQPRQFPRHKRPGAIGGRLVVEEIADMGKDARVVRDGIVYGGAECLA